MLLEGNNGSDFVILSLDGGEHLLATLALAVHLVHWGPEGLEGPES